MGSQQSRIQGNNSTGNGVGDDGDSNDCQVCFFLDRFGKVLRKATSKTSDGLGTPLPDTPLYQRKKREQVQKAMRNKQQEQDGLFSSKYAGLEKEQLIPPQQAQHRRDESIVHEGPDCERLLHQKYQLMEAMGVGSTSTVHRCMSKVNNEYYACKIIDVELIEERFQGMMAQFQTEIDALKSLRHPGIIELYDVYMTDRKIYIVMELMDGGELFDYVVQKGTLTEEEASRIVRKVTSAIAYMHSKNFIHRDLKPENLLLKRKPKTPHDEIDVKVIDFGLSKVCLIFYEILYRRRRRRTILFRALF